MVRQIIASRRAILLTAAAGLAAPGIARGQTTRFRFNLGWRVEASAAGYLLAAERGYFREEGLDVVIDTGNGSAGAITAVAGGAYDGASADFASLIGHNLANPTRRLVAAAIQYDRNPNALIVRANSPIRAPRDFIGKRIAGQPANASRALFPIFARAQGIPVDSVQWQSVDPGLGNQLFIRGEVDAIAFFFFTGPDQPGRRRPAGRPDAELRLRRLRAAGLRQRHGGQPAAGHRQPPRADRLHPRFHPRLARLRGGPRGRRPRGEGAGGAGRPCARDAGGCA
jgi:hypothetical protein